MCSTYEVASVPGTLTQLVPRPSEGGLVWACRRQLPPFVTDEMVEKPEASVKESVGRVMAVITRLPTVLAWPSSATSRKPQVPPVEKLAVVAWALGLAKVTVPGPLTSLQVSVTVPGGLGLPSSDTVPLMLADLR